MNRGSLAEVLRKVPRKVVLGDCGPECADYLKPHVHGSLDVDYEGMADAVLQHLASQRQEQGDILQARLNVKCLEVDLLKGQLDADDARIYDLYVAQKALVARLGALLRDDVLPRYMELFVINNLGTAEDSVLVQQIQALLASLPSPEGHATGTHDE